MVRTRNFYILAVSHRQSGFRTDRHILRTNFDDTSFRHRMHRVHSKILNHLTDLPFIDLETVDIIRYIEVAPNCRSAKHEIDRVA